MARTINRLNPKFVASVTAPGRYADGNGLYLVTKGGGRRWVFLYRWQGKHVEMGLGSAQDISLARARELAVEARSLLTTGANPVEARRIARHTATEPQQRDITFGDYAEQYIASVESGWRNPVHRQQWRNSLRDHAKNLKNLPVASIGTDDVLATLQPIWTKIPETADRVRGRIEKILNAAKARGLRDRDSINPAAWAGHLEVLLPRRRKLSRGHHAAMAYADIPAFTAALRERAATAAIALEFLILCAARTGEVIGAKRKEIHGNLWIIPAERMKAGVEHTVTLSDRALELIAELGPGKPDDYLFTWSTSKRPLSNMAMDMLLRRMNRKDCTVHGFRSAFKDWALNCTEFPDEISEEALAHIVGSKVRRAYRRGEALDRRRRLMVAWAEHCGSAVEHGTQRLVA